MAYAGDNLPRCTVLVFLRRLLLHMLYPLAYMLGRFNTGSSHGNTTRRLAPRYAELQDLVPGDIIVSRTKWRPTNPLIPGYWSHAGMYVGNDTVVHALAPHVVETPLQDFMSMVDAMAVVRPWRTGRYIMSQAAAHMRSFVGTPYDFMFEPTTKALYCSEAVAQAYWAVTDDWTFIARKRMGLVTVLPQDFYDARKHFTVVWDSRA